MKKLLFISYIAIALSACGDKKADRIPNKVIAPSADAIQTSVEANAVKREKGFSDGYMSSEAAPPTVHQVAEDIEKKIIKEGSISFETDNVKDTRKQLLASLKKLGGYVNSDNESVNGDYNRKEYTLEIRIPAKNFDSFLGSVSSTATKIDSKNISIRDITTEYIDTKTRLDNKKILEKRYLALLDKATKMADVLEIESKLSDIRSEIESTQGQLNYMNKQVDYSSLNITFYTKQTQQVAAGNGFVYKLKEALSGGLGFLQSLFFGIIALWPLWAIVIIIIVAIRVRRKRNVDM